REPLVVAEGRHFDSRRFGGVDQQSLRRGLHRAPIDRQVDNVGHYTPTMLPACSKGQGLPLRWSSNSWRNFSTMEIVGSAAASPSGQNVRPSMFFEISPIRLMSVVVPCPSWKRVRIFFSQVVPSRHGMHQPQLSWA